MVRIWNQYRGGGMGAGHLPEAGGTGDQAAIMMDALLAMDAAEGELRAAEKRR
ncbi:MAG: hypothetical protein AB7P02_09420 [Alphaproteobacteria bacterium]